MKSTGLNTHSGGSTVVNEIPRSARLGIRVRRFIIFSSSVSRIEVMKKLKAKKIDFKFMQGCYNGLHEDSYLVDADNLNAIEKMDLLNGEESVLHLGHYDHTKERRAWLHYLNPIIIDTDLGYLVQVSERYAKAQGNWTFDPQTGLYYTTKMEV